MIAEREETALLQTLGVERDVRDALDGPLGVKAWLLPGALPRPVVVRDPGVPEWWTGDDEASASFLGAMGVNLQ